MISEKNASKLLDNICFKVLSDRIVWQIGVNGSLIPKKYTQIQNLKKEEKFI